VVLRQLLDAETLAHCRKVYEWRMQNPSKIAQEPYPRFYDDSSGTKAGNPVIRDLLDQRPVFGDTLQKLWGSEMIWFQDWQIFHKWGGEARRTAFHQDTSLIPFAGQHLVNMWISFEETPLEDSVEVVLGSHKGTQFNGTRSGSAKTGKDGTESIHDHSRDTEPLYTKEQHEEVGLQSLLPPLPDVLAKRENFDLASFRISPGDVVCFHPGLIHGGAPLTRHQERNTLVLRFFGEDCYYRTLPFASVQKQYRHMRDGEHFSRAKGYYYGTWLQVRGPNAEENNRAAEERDLHAAAVRVGAGPGRPLEKAAGKAEMIARL